MTFFLHHRVEEVLNFLQSNFALSKIAKIMVRVECQYSLTPANVLFNLENPNLCTVNYNLVLIWKSISWYGRVVLCIQFSILYIYIKNMCVCACVCVLTLKGGGGCFRCSQFFDTRKTLKKLLLNSWKHIWKTMVINILYIFKEFQFF